MANLDALLRIKTDVQGANSIVALNRGLQGVERTAAGASVAMRGMAGSSALLTSSLGALVPLMSAAGLVGLVKGAIDAGDAMNDLSQRTGVSVEALAKFKKAAATSGTDIDNVAKGLNKLNRGMFEAATTGKGKAADALNFLGISATNAAGKLKTADQVTLEIADKFSKIQDPAAKAALAADLFGKAGVAMIPMLNSGSKAITDLSTKMTTAFAQKADEYSDKLVTLSGKVGALGADLAIALLPALNAVTDAVTAGMTAFNSMPDVLKSATLSAAALALAWGPLTGLMGTIGKATAPLVANAMANLALQTTLAGGTLPPLEAGLVAVRGAMLAIPGWGWALAGATALAALTTYVYSTNKAFRDFVGNLGDVISGDFKRSMEAMGNFAKGAGQYIGGVWGGLVKNARWAGDQIAKAFGERFGFIADIARETMGWVSQQISGMVSAIPKAIRDKLGIALSDTSRPAWSVPIGAYAAGAVGRALSMGPRAEPAAQGGGGAIPEPAQTALNLSGYGGGGAGAGGGGRAGGAKAPVGQIIEYLTGDRSSGSYRADHGGSNYHDHLAFASTAQRDAAMKELRAAGIRIGSVNDGRHARGSYHYSGQAFDVPGGQVPVGQEAGLSALVRKVLSGAGFVGKGIGRAAGYSDDLASLRVQGEEKAAEAAKKAKEDAKHKAEDDAKSLNSARDLLTTKEAALRVAEAISPLEKLNAEYDQARAQRMGEYADKLQQARTDEERRVLVAAQLADARASELGYQEKLKAIANDQLIAERERAQALADSMAYMQEMSSRTSVGAGLQQGIESYVESIGNMRDAVGKLTTDSIGGLENSLTELATTGTTNFKAFAASVLADTSRMIIRQMVLKTIMSLIGGIGGGVAKTFEMPGFGGFGGGSSVDFGQAMMMPKLFAKGGAFGAGYDIVTQPTMFRFASGGSFNQGVMGEAGPEAVMPLRRGPDGRLGVSAPSGASSGPITINVDARGTKSEGDRGAAGALARDLARVVDDRLIHHRRPGGLLSAA